MNNFVLTDKGAVIEITNNSTEQIITNNEGFISPTLTPLGNTVSNEIKPAFTIQIPSFVSYKINNIAPGDSISFVVTKPDEVFYYLGIANSKIEGVSVNVTPITNDTTLQDKTIVPTTEEQVVTADEGYDGLGTVTVEAINLQNKTVTPTTSQQTISANEGYSGLGTVTVEAVTASIDENITAENIKKDVEILGVTGNYEGSGGGGGNATLETTDTEFNYISNYASLLTSIEIPDGITSIGDNAFDGCDALISVTMGNSVESIGDSAFNGCSSLSSITIGNSVESIGDNAFNGCSSLTSITIPDSVTDIGGGIFTDCSSLESVIIEGNLERLDETFYNLESLVSLVFLGSLPDTSIDICQDCTNLQSVSFSSASTINGFTGCSNLTDVTLPNDLLELGGFNNCESLESIEIPNTVTTISTGAFDGCTGLTHIILPESVTAIGDWAFSNCDNLEFLEFLSTNPPEIYDYRDGILANVPASCIIYVPNGTLSAYTSASNYPDPSTYTYVERPAT